MATRHSFLSTAGLVRAPSPGPSVANANPSAYATRRQVAFGGTPSTSDPKEQNRSKNLKKLKLSSKFRPQAYASAGVIPLSPTFLVGLAAVISLCFIVVISFAFLGAEDEAIFKNVLDNLAETNPGVRLPTTSRYCITNFPARFYS